MVNATACTSRNGLVAYFAENVLGRDLLGGDVQGCFSLLEAALSRAGFDPRVDRLFLAGDLVDRGPESAEVLDWLARPWVNAVRGNHDNWCIEGGILGTPPEGHELHGGEWFYRLPSAKRTEIARELQRLPIAIEVTGRDGQRSGIVHAGCTMPKWDDFTAILIGEHGNHQMARHAIEAMWTDERFKAADATPIAGLQRLFVGHNRVKALRQLGNTIYTDTGCGFADGALTIIDMHTMASWSTRAPATRTDF